MDEVEDARPPVSASASGLRSSRRRRTRPPLPSKPQDLSTRATAGIQYQLLQQQQNGREGADFTLLGLNDFKYDDMSLEQMLGLTLT